MYHSGVFFATLVVQLAMANGLPFSQCVSFLFAPLFEPTNISPVFHPVKTALVVVRTTTLKK
jgi:hypothetical protein